jgi:hypothetical protein
VPVRLSENRRPRLFREHRNDYELRHKIDVACQEGGQNPAKLRLMLNRRMHFLAGRMPRENCFANGLHKVLSFDQFGMATIRIICVF